MAASVPPAHAALFAAKVFSPITNSAAANTAASGQPITLLGPPSIPPRPELTQSAATDEDNGMGYALSLLGPITLLSAHELARNLQAIAQLPADTAAPSVMPAAMLRRVLRDLLTEQLEHAQAPLQMARHALRQAPQLLISAMADASRDLNNSAAEGLSAFAKLAEILAPATPASHPALVSLMSELVASIRSLRVIPSGQAIVNPGVVLIEGRGAETDAGFLKHVAQWVLPDAPQPKAVAANVIVTTNLTEEAFRAQLRVYSEMKPAKEDQAVIDALLIALNVKKLALNTLRENRPFKVHDQLRTRTKKPAQPMPWLLFSANPALVDLTGGAPPVQHVLWTLSGRALDTGRIDFKSLYVDRWRALTAPTQHAGVTA
jgi:hypothetical protein